MKDPKVAVVFGVRNERSIAFAVARKLVETGFRVAVSYTEDTQEDVLYYLEQAGIPTDLCGSVDVRDEAQMVAYLQMVSQQAGPIDALLHSVAFGNHKVLCSKPPFTDEAAPSYLDIPFADLVEAIDISAYSLLRLVRAARPYLAEQASFLTTTFNASQRVIPQYAGMAIAKACLENIMQYLAHFLGEEGHRINALSPGLIMTTSAAGIQGVRTMRKQAAAMSPLGKIRLEDVAEAAVYYFSDASKRVTGNIHYIDGGLNIMGGLP